MRKLGVVLLLVWGVLFLAGAAGEIFQIESLRELTDLKRIFLR